MPTLLCMVGKVCFTLHKNKCISRFSLESRTAILYAFQLMGVLFMLHFLKHEWQCFWCLFQSMCQFWGSHCPFLIIFFAFFFNNCVLFRSNSSNTAQKKQYQRRWDYTEIHKYASVAPTSSSLTQTEKLFFKTYTDFCNTHIRNKEIKVCADNLHKPISETNHGRRHTFV